MNQHSEKTNPYMQEAIFFLKVWCTAKVKFTESILYGINFHRGNFSNRENKKSPKPHYTYSMPIFLKKKTFKKAEFVVKNSLKYASSFGIRRFAIFVRVMCFWLIYIFQFLKLQVLEKTFLPCFLYFVKKIDKVWKIHSRSFLH